MADELTGKLIADKYRVEALIGESDAGDLFAARNEIMDKPVTIKVLPQALAMDQRWSRRFLDEARAAATVNHPNILNLSDFGSDSRGVPYAVFEPIDGVLLSDMISASIDEKRAVSIAAQIAGAVASAHEKKLVHGRLSPQTVFVSTDESGTDSVKVYGFGGDPLNVGGDADPRYLAPEQSNSFPVADGRTDVYALGVMIFEMLSGVLPYEGSTAAEVQAKLAGEPPPPLSAFRKDLNPEIEPIVLTAMAASPDRRYQTMAAFAEDLSLLSSRIAPAKKDAAAAEPKKEIWKTAAVAFVGIAALAAMLIYATSVRKTDPTDQLQADVSSLPVQPIGPATGAQEESLAKLPALTDAEIMASASQPLLNDLPGGDGYNAWANGGAPPPGAPPLGAVPPAGAPLNQGMPTVEYIQPGGQTYTVPSSGSGSQFMPSDSGVILVPVPVSPEANTAAKPAATPGKTAANTAAQPSPTPAGPKPLATPPPKTKPADTTKGKSTTPSTAKPKTSKPGEDLQF